MTKLISITILFICTQNLLNGQVYVEEKKYKNHLEADKVKGNVRSMKDIHYKTPQFISDTTTWGVMDWYILTTYNSSGNRVERKHVRNDSTLARIEQYFYSGQQLAQEIGESPGAFGTKETTVYKYDKAGNKIEQKLTISKGTVTINLTTFKYDAKNRMIEMFVTRPPDGSTAKRNYKYDQSNRVIEEAVDTKTYSADITYKYDLNKITTYQWSKTKGKQGPVDTSIWVYKYDTYGNEISGARIKDANTGYQYIYEYDTQGNWLKQFILDGRNKGGKPRLNRARLITYY